MQGSGSIFSSITRQKVAVFRRFLLLLRGLALFPGDAAASTLRQMLGAALTVLAWLLKIEDSSEVARTAWLRAGQVLREERGAAFWRRHDV